MPTSGPIVRTGATPEFWRNWDNIFGEKKKRAGKTATGKQPAKKTAKAAAAKKTATTKKTGKASKRK